MKTSLSFTVPMNLKLGLLRILSNANAKGFSSRSKPNLCFVALDVTVRLELVSLNGEWPKRAEKVSPSRSSNESGRDIAPRYSRREEDGLDGVPHCLVDGVVGIDLAGVEHNSLAGSEMGSTCVAVARKGDSIPPSLFATTTTQMMWC